MVWVIAVIAAAIGFFIYINRPSRLVVQLSAVANQRYTKKDWAGALKFLRIARQKTDALKDPLRTRMTGVIELQTSAALYRLGQMEEAEDLLRQGLVKARSGLPEGSEVLVHGEVTWGDLCTDCGRHTEAEQHYRRALAANEQRGNVGATVFDLQRLADCLLNQDRSAEATEAMRRAKEVEASIVKGNPISMCQPDIHFCLGEYEEARQLYRVKVQFWEGKSPRPEQIDLGRLQMRLAFAEAKTGHIAEAEETYTRAEATFQSDWCAEHPKAVAARVARVSLREEKIRA
jgi:tetratricopeptide (TPR) repeat protein